MSKFDWSDPLWEAEYQPGKLYKARIIFFDGHAEEGWFRYIGKQRNPVPVNGYEHLIMPEFEQVAPLGLNKGRFHVKTFEVIGASTD